MHPAGLKRLIRKAIALITREAAEAAVATGITPHQHNPAGVDGIALQAAEIHTPFTHQLVKRRTDRVRPKTAHKGGRGAKASQCAGHIGGGTA